MADPSLSTTTDSQSQTITQSPQSNVQSINSGSKTSSVQPGTDTDLLNSSSGSVSLHPTTLPTVSLNNTQSVSAPTPAATPQPTKQHHVNPTLFGFSLLLFVVAVVLVWTTGRSARSL